MEDQKQEQRLEDSPVVKESSLLPEANSEIRNNPEDTPTTT